MKNNLSSNQLIIVIVEKSPVKKKTKVFMNPEIPEEQVTLEKYHCHCLYVMLRFKKEVGVDSKEEQADVEDDTD